MPSYEWTCDNTHCPQQDFEVRMSMQDIEEGTVVHCPVCDYPAERIMSIFGGNFGETPRYHQD